MKEITHQEIRLIADREMRELARYEMLIAWGRSGALRKAADAFYAEVAEAKRQQAIAELRVAQIEVIQTTAAQWDARAVRNALANENAEKQQAAALGRQAIQEAVDEVLALEEIVPEKDIVDILSQLSAALDIELPTSADRPDICQRKPKTMEDLKCELGPSLATFIANPAESTQKAVDAYKTADELIADVRRTALTQGMTDISSEEFHTAGIVRQAAEDKLTAFVKSLIDRVNFPLDQVEWVKPKRGEITPIQEVEATTGALYAPTRPPVYMHQWLMENIAEFDSDHCEWLDRYHPDDTLDAETLRIARDVVCDGFDAGLTFEELKAKVLSGVPPDRPPGLMTREEAKVLMAT